MHMTPLLPDDTFKELPIIATRATDGYPPTEYTALQKALLPYIDSIHLFWWSCLVVTMAYVITRFLVLPFVRNGWKLDPAPAIATSPVGGWRGRYRRVFRLDEFEQDPLLSWCAGAALLGLLVTFKGWQTNAATTVEGLAAGRVTCWPFFQSCHDLVFLHAFPHAYSQMIAYMALYGLMLFACYALIFRKFEWAHMSMLVLFAAKIYFTLISFFFNGNFDYYNTTFFLVLLFIPHRRFFLSLTVLMFYVLSTVAKIHPSWSLGMYFTAMVPGLPLFPNSIAPLMTNLVIFMEMVMAWFLLSHRKVLQRCVFAFFVTFHLYSGLIVAYHYPTIVMPMLLLCFGPQFKPFARVPMDKFALPGWGLAVVLWGLQSIQLWIPGDAKLTLEGNFYGLYMFEANHQCRVIIKNEKGDTLREKISWGARNRCDPWPHLSSIKQRYCKDQPTPRIHFNMIHSVNGGPFYEIVDEKDACQLTYKPFSRNEWIKDATTAPIVGRPLKNLYDPSPI